MILRGATAIAAAGWALLACACENLVEDVPTSVCASGKRWVGGNMGHEEMNPGQDCLACHREMDGPEFMIAGTVYGIYDADGSRTVNNDCFGIEGACISVTAADGQVTSRWAAALKAEYRRFHALRDELARAMSEVMTANERPRRGGASHDAA